jgi:type II secretory pathway pseudopilin PulG
MKKAFLTLAAVGALAAAAPAAAQYGQYGNTNAGGRVGIDNRLARLDARIQAGIQSGAIDRREARSLRQQLRDIQRLERQYSYNGLSQQERMDLQQRLRAFRDELRYADGGRSDQYGNSNWNDDYNNRGGGYDDDYSGRGGPYEDVDCDSDRGGIAGIFDSIFGGGSSSNCSGSMLRVGARASGDLRSLPSEYRYRYRDGNGVYYRHDGRSIYQIDARTNTVVRIYPMNN